MAKGNGHTNNRYSKSEVHVLMHSGEQVDNSTPLIMVEQQRDSFFNVQGT